MKILLVSSITKDSRTGVTAHYNRLMEQLPNHVESVSLLTPDDTPWLVKKCFGALRRLAKLGGHNASALCLELENFISMWVTVRKYHSTHSFDLVHAQDVTAGAGAALGLAGKIPVVTTCHFNDDPLTEYKLRPQLSDWTHNRLLDWYQFLFKQHTAFITVSHYIKKTSAFLRPEGAACEVIHNGVRFSDFPFERSETDFTIINTGTIESRKNQRLLIEAAEELRNRGFTNLKIWLLGDGPKRQEWEKFVQKKGLQETVFFLGYQNDIPRFLRSASLYVHTAVNESWGYSITEAIAAGTPVLALATGGIPEQFNERQVGLLSRSTTAYELANAIQDFRDAEKRKQLAMEQMGFAQKRFNLEGMIRKHVAFYRLILNKKPTNPAFYKSDNELVTSSPQSLRA